MGSNTTTITLGNREFKLIGTAHVSKESIEEVRKIISEEKPDMVCVELDKGRYNSITQNDTWEKLDLAKVFKEGKGFLLIANLVLAGFQKRLGNDLGVKPGEEMKTAIETANEIGAPFSFCDREVHTTLRRAWAKCGLWNKCKLLSALLASAFTNEKMDEKEIESLKDKNELDGMMSELANYLPPVKEVLIDERDKYLASKIWTATPPEENAHPSGAAPKKIAAVVGAGHMKGMIAHMEKLSKGEVTADVSEIDVVPPPGILSKIAGFVIPAALVALIAAGFFFAGAQKGGNMMLEWIIWNGSLAALGSLIALAHPLAIIVSFLGAPLATINPFIGVGLFSGLVQIIFRKPQVSDAQNITEDATSVKGFYKNRITRALLVFFLSTIGGATGNFIAIPRLVTGLFGG